MRLARPADGSQSARASGAPDPRPASNQSESTDSEFNGPDAVGSSVAPLEHVLTCPDRREAGMVSGRRGAMAAPGAGGFASLSERGIGKEGDDASAFGHSYFLRPACLSALFRVPGGIELPSGYRAPTVEAIIRGPWCRRPDLRSMRCPSHQRALRGARPGPTWALRHSLSTTAIRHRSGTPSTEQRRPRTSPANCFSHLPGPFAVSVAPTVINRRAFRRAASAALRVRHGTGRRMALDGYEHGSAVHAGRMRSHPHRAMMSPTLIRVPDTIQDAVMARA
jgi:hypothetical protein